MSLQMSRIFYIVISIAFLSCSQLMAQGKGGVSVHSDPRLALLINKTKVVDRVDEYKPAVPKKEKAVKEKNPSNNSLADVKFVEYKEPPAKRKPAADDTKEPKETKIVRRNFSSSSTGTNYHGNGFRVQIYNGPDRADALRIKAEFMRNYPGVRTYLTYTSPHYRVKVGDFRRREDALGMFKEANDTYSPCMIVPDVLGSK